MCLDRITKTKLNKSGEAYKILRQTDDGTLQTLVYNFKGERLFGFIEDERPTDMQLGKEYTDTNTSPIDEHWVVYPSGFHLFTNKRLGVEWANDVHWTSSNLHDGTKSVLVKVKYSEGHTIGIQSGGNVIVANKMTIIEVLEEIE